MTELRNYSKSFLTDFINLYHKNSCLWNTNSKQYYNRALRLSTYEILVDKLKEVDPDADKNLVVRKLNALRSSFRREQKKVLESKQLGTGDGLGNRIYKPRLWYYDLLSTFVTTNENPSKSETGSIHNLEEYDISFTEPSVKDESVTVNYPELAHFSMYDSNEATNQNTPFEELQTYSIPSTPFKSINELSMDKEDEIEFYGKVITSKLRGMPKGQRIIAEKMMNEVLYYGEIQRLNYGCASKFGHWIYKETVIPLCEGNHEEL